MLSPSKLLVLALTYAIYNTVASAASLRGDSQRILASAGESEVKFPLGAILKTFGAAFTLAVGCYTAIKKSCFDNPGRNQQSLLSTSYQNYGTSTTFTRMNGQSLRFTQR